MILSAPMLSGTSVSTNLDTELSMTNHVNKIASACFYQRQIRHYVSREVLKQLATSRPVVLSRLDYCNSVLVGNYCLVDIDATSARAERCRPASARS